MAKSKQIKPKRSYFESGGKLWVACCECVRGGNGDGSDNCSSGWKCKRWNGLGCFIGTLLDKYDYDKIPNYR